MVLTDFGLCKECVEPEETTSTFCGTPEVCGRSVEKADREWLRAQTLGYSPTLQQEGPVSFSQARPGGSPVLSLHFLVNVREPAFGDPATSDEFSCCPMEIGRRIGWMWGCMPAIPTLGKWGLEGQEFEVSLNYRVGSRSAGNFRKPNTNTYKPYIFIYLLWC